VIESVYNLLAIIRKIGKEAAEFFGCSVEEVGWMSKGGEEHNYIDNAFTFRVHQLDMALHGTQPLKRVHFEDRRYFNCGNHLGLRDQSQRSLATHCPLFEVNEYLYENAVRILKEDVEQRRANAMRTGIRPTSSVDERDDDVVIVPRMGDKNEDMPGQTGQGQLGDSGRSLPSWATEIESGYSGRSAHSGERETEHKHTTRSPSRGRDSETLGEDGTTVGAAPGGASTTAPMETSAGSFVQARDATVVMIGQGGDDEKLPFFEHERVEATAKELATMMEKKVLDLYPFRRLQGDGAWSGMNDAKDASLFVREADLRRGFAPVQELRTSWRCRGYLDPVGSGKNIMLARKDWWQSDANRDMKKLCDPFMLRLAAIRAFNSYRGWDLESELDSLEEEISQILTAWKDSTRPGRARADRKGEEDKPEEDRQPSVEPERPNKTARFAEQPTSVRVLSPPPYHQPGPLIVHVGAKRSREPELERFPGRDGRERRKKKLEEMAGQSLTTWRGR